MTEGPPKPFENIEAEREQERERIRALVMELSQHPENFPFSGIDREAYAKMKAVEAEYPGYTTPIDELIERFKNEGMKVTAGKDPKKGDAYILPSQSDDIENDSVSPKQLEITEAMDEKLKELILMKRSWEKKYASTRK